MTNPATRSSLFRETWHRRLGEARPPPELDRLALVIASCGRADGTRAVASHRWLAARMGWSERTVKRRLADLMSAGWIARTEKGGRRGDGTVTANVYALSSPPLSTGQEVAGAGLMRPALNGPATTAQQANHYASTGQDRSGDGPPPGSQSPGTTPPQGGEPDGFDDWLALYPETEHNRTRREVLAAYRHALLETDQSELVAGLRRWLPTFRERGPHFTTAPTTWLREGRWKVAAPVGAGPRDIVPDNFTEVDPAVQRAVAETWPPPRTEPASWR